MKPDSKPAMKQTLPLPLSLITGKSMPALMLATGLGLVLAHPLAAKDNLLGTPGALPVDDGYIFTNNTASTKQGIKVNSTSSVSGALGSEWWGANPEPFGLVDDSTEADEIVAHVKDPLTGGDTYWMSMSFEYPQSEYKGVVRGNQNGLFLPGAENLDGGGLPDATEIYIGLDFYNDDLTNFDDTLEDIQPANLTFVDHATPTVANTPDGMTKWYNFTIADGTLEWEFIVEDGKDNADALLANWVVGVVLPDSWMDTSEYTEIDDLLIDGYDKKGNAITAGPGDTYWTTTEGEKGLGGKAGFVNNNGTKDIFFRWTVDEKGIPVDDPDSPNYNDGDFPQNPDFENDLFAPDPVVVIPEPSSSVLVMLGTLALIMRRKRS